MKRRAARNALDVLVRDAARLLNVTRAYAEEADDCFLQGAVTTASIEFLALVGLAPSRSPARALQRLAAALETLAADDGLDDEPRRRRALRALAAHAATIGSARRSQTEAPRRPR